METPTLLPDQTAPAGGNPGIGVSEPGTTHDNGPLPVPDAQGQATAGPPTPPSTPPAPARPKKQEAAPPAPYAAAAKSPVKNTKKPHINPESYRKSKAPEAEEPFSEGAQTTVPVRKPGKRNFFRVHPEEEYRLYNVPVVEDDNHEWHILAPELEIPDDLERFVSHVNLFTCINHKGTLFLWPFKNSTNDWSKSASRITRRAVTEWVRLQADMDANGYRVETAPAELRAVEPEWPDMTFEEILNAAFEDKCIDSLDHPIIRSLRGCGYGPAL